MYCSYRFDHLIIDYKNLLYRALNFSLNALKIDVQAAHPDINDKSDEFQELMAQELEKSDIIIFVEAVVRYIENIRVKYFLRRDQVHLGLEGRNNWRYEYYPDYKGNRKYGSVLDKKVFEYSRKIQELLSYSKYRVWNGRNCEGDDVFGTLSRRLDGNVAIYSSDRDLLQLSTDNVFNIVSMRGKEDVVLNRRDHIKKFGYEPSRRIFIKALEGDIGDNIPGVKNIGFKTALGLSDSFETIEDLKTFIETESFIRKGEKKKDYNARLKARCRSLTPKVAKTIYANLKDMLVSYIIGSIIIDADIYEIKSEEFESYRSFMDFLGVNFDERKYNNIDLSAFNIKGRD